MLHETGWKPVPLQRETLWRGAKNPVGSRTGILPVSLREMVRQAVGLVMPYETGWKPVPLGGEPTPLLEPGASHQILFREIF